MIFCNLIAGVALLVSAPLCMGVIKKTKAWTQNRRGFSVWQLYYDYWKLFHKDEVISQRSTQIFRLAPYVYFIAIFTAASALPVFLGYGLDSEVFLIIGLLATSRLALVMAAFDTGSAFAGIGAERELFFSVLFEPAFLVVILAKVLHSGTGLGGMAFYQMAAPFDLPGLMLAIAFFMLMVAESGRIPVDNPDTHLELTMVHEAMLLEYSGKRLALLLWAAALRQLLYVIIFVQIFVPWQMWSDLGLIKYWSIAFCKVLFTLVLLALTETLTNKMRVFRVPGYVGVVIALAIFAVFAQ